MGDDTQVSRTLVIALGNPLVGDGGLGLAVLERLREDWELPPEVELIPAEGWEASLLPGLDWATRLIVVDGVDLGREPDPDDAHVRREIPLVIATPIHGADPANVLCFTEWRHDFSSPVPGDVSGTPGVAATVDLSPRIRRRVNRAVSKVIRRLRAWGHPCRLRACHAYA